MKKRHCTNRDCPSHRDGGQADIAVYGFYKTKAGKRRRFRCRLCKRSFASTAGTPYYRLQHSRSTFDEVAALSVEGVSKSAISRVKSIAWNTVHSWHEKAAGSCQKFSVNKTKNIDIRELQADEIKTFAGDKKTPVWIFAALDVWSRFWPATIVGKRSCENTRKLFRKVSEHANPQQVPLIVTDGFEFYRSAARLCFPKCLYAQVIKTRRKDRIIKVERRIVIGSETQFGKALEESEDSDTLNTSFIERLNLTIRQGTAFLTRRTTCFARFPEYLINQLDILRCHYNFLRPHGGLKFGVEKRTPAMQAGLAKGRLSFRDVFTFRLVLIVFGRIVARFHLKMELRLKPA